jgi:SH3-like domain-containing protein
MFQRHYTATSQNYGVVIEESIKTFAAPFSSATELFVIHGGTKVRILDQDSEWLKIELIDGKQGWVPSENIGII